MKPLDIDSIVLQERDKYLESFSGLPNVELFKACSEDPAVFAFYMLGIKLYGWQFLVTREIIKGNKRVILNTSRQIGKSLLSSVISLWFAVFNKGLSSEFKNTKVGVISATDDQAKKVMKDIKNLIYIGNHYCRQHYSVAKQDLFDRGLFSFLVDDSRDAENNKSTITFKSWSKEFGILLNQSLIGSFIKCYPPTDIVRGETFDLLFVDEAAQIDDEVYNMAIEKTGEKFDAVRIMASTPYGYSGFFYEFFDPDDRLEDNMWTRFAFTIDAIALDEPLEHTKRMRTIQQDYALGKVLKIRQENYCEFVQSEQSFFSPEKVDAMFEDYSMVESYTGECDLGIDFGGLKKSQTVLTIMCMTDDGEVRRLYHHAYPVRQDGELIEDIASLRRRFNIQRIIVDECPEGDFMQRKMVDMGWNVVGMKFGAEKVKKYGELRAYIHKGRVKSYRDTELQGQLKALMTKQGTERTKIQPPPGYQDDFADSLLLGCYFYIMEDSGFKCWDIEDD